MKGVVQVGNRKNIGQAAHTFPLANQGGSRRERKGEMREKYKVASVERKEKKEREM